MELCPALGIAIPVGKDSHVDAHGVAGRRRDADSVTAPLSLIVTRVRAGDRRAARAHAGAARRRGTTRAAAGRPRPRQEPPGRLGAGAGLRRSRRRRARPRRSGAACAASSPRSRTLNAAGLLLAYHDRSRRRPVRDAAARWRSRAAPAWTSTRRRCGGDAARRAVHRGAGRGGAGARARRRARVRERARRATGSATACTRIGARAARRPRSRIARDGRALSRASARSVCARIWSETTHAMQALRDNPRCADEEHAARVDAERSRACRRS